LKSVHGYLKLKCVLSVSLESQNGISKIMTIFKWVLQNTPLPDIGWNKTDSPAQNNAIG